MQKGKFAANPIVRLESQTTYRSTFLLVTYMLSLLLTAAPAWFQSEVEVIRKCPSEQRALKMAQQGEASGKVFKSAQDTQDPSPQKLLEICPSSSAILASVEAHSDWKSSTTANSAHRYNYSSPALQKFTDPPRQG